MSTVNYLAYGSNLFPPRLAARIPIRAESGTVLLPDRALAFTKRGRDGSAKCTLAAHPGAQAWAAVYRIDAADKPTLDAIEGVGRGYAVAWLDCPPHGACFVYLATADALVDDWRPYDWYKAYVMAGASYHALPAAYVAAIEAVPAVADLDQERAAMNFTLIG